MRLKVLNRDIIKYFAIILMLLDHVIQLFMPRGIWQYKALDSLTHFTFVTMSFFLVEGYQYTRSKKAYAKRLFLFALISQLPYTLAFSEEKVFSYVALNIFFTLGFCFLMIWGLDQAEKKWVKVLIVLAAMEVCTFCDWMYFAPLITLAFYLARGSKGKLIVAYAFAMLLYGLSNCSGYLVPGRMDSFVREFLISTHGILLSGICIVALYNGERMKSARKFNKWFFYLFYPLHLLILGMIRIAML
ncbi:MAG: TraX family protein [Lachnospiraceae bacterium]